MELPGSFLSPSSKNKKHLPQKSFLYYRKWNVLALRLKNFFYFRKSNFLALRLKNSLYFWNWNYLASYFSIFQKETFRAQKILKNPLRKFFLYFGKWNFLALSLKNSYFQEGTCKTRKTNKKSALKELLIFLQKRFSSHFGMTAQKTFLYSEQKRVSYSLMYQLFFRTINLSLYSLLLRYSFFSYRILNNAPHHRYLTEFWI